MKEKYLEKSFWQEKKVLITGHTGFKGGWLSLWLHNLGAQTFGISLPAEKQSFYHAIELENYIENYFCDICNYKKIHAIIEKIQPEVVFHLAAQPLVLDSYNDPILTYNTNVMGTLHVLQACRKQKSVKAVVNITTDKCYENKNWEWGYRETDSLGGYDPYSSSKACSEILTSSFRRSFCQDKNKETNLQIATVRAGNVFGGGDWAKDRLIPDAARALSQNKSVSIRNPFSTRPWQFVLEPIRAYIQIAELLMKYPNKYCEAWNVGPDDCDVVSVQNILDLFCKTWSLESSFKVISNSDFFHEQKNLKLDTSKIKARVGWQQNLNLVKAIENTTHWYKLFYNTSSTAKELYSLSLEQISIQKDNFFYNQFPPLHKKNSKALNLS